ATEHQKDIEDLRGTWKLRAVETGGRRKDPKHLQTELRIDWSALALVTPEGYKGATYQIDVSRRPKTIDMVAEATMDRQSTSVPIVPGLSTGKFAGRKITVKAIYLLEGDRLT